MSGVFVCTHNQLVKLSDAALSEAFVEVDELHELLKLKQATEKLQKAKQVLALSATLGNSLGKQRLEERFGSDCTILDTI